MEGTWSLLVGSGLPESRVVGSTDRRVDVPSLLPGPVDPTLDFSPPSSTWSSRLFLLPLPSSSSVLNRRTSGCLY